MKKSRSTAVLTAAVLPFMELLSASAADTSISRDYTDFNPNDVNGHITVEIPEDAAAYAAVTMSSPETSNEPYYTGTIAGGDSYTFDIEGRDNTDDDYRNYTLQITLTGGVYDSSEFFGISFTIPDGDNNPGSTVNETYRFILDDQLKQGWDIISSQDGVTEIAVHLNGFLLGDIDGDSAVLAADASMALAEYSKLSVGISASFDERQKAAADINADDVIDAADASSILAYYALASTSSSRPSWNTILRK